MMACWNCLTLRAEGYGQEEAHLRSLTNAITAMFAEMTSAYEGVKFESDEKRWPIKFFLTEFDAIYTLNQDTLSRGPRPRFSKQYHPE